MSGREFVGMLSVGFRSGYNNATLAAVNQWFRRQRSLAMSIVAAGNGLGGAVLAPLEGLMVASLGWRTAALLSGLGILIVVVPLSFLVWRSPESMGLLPDGDQVPALPASQPPGPPRMHGTTADSPAPAVSPVAGCRDAAQLDFTAPEAMRALFYWLLILATGLRNTVHSGMSFLMAPVVIWFLQGGGRSADSSLPMAAFFVGLLSFGTFVLTPSWGGWAIEYPSHSSVPCS